MPPIAVSLDRAEPAVGIVSLVGEHDAYSAHRLADELGLLLDSDVHVAVDLTDATFIDSQTLSALLKARNTAEGRSLGFVLVLSPDDYTQVHRILDMTGLVASFVTRPTREEAVAAARAHLADPHRVGVG
jgi:anti-anti-sigma factor